MLEWEEDVLLNISIKERKGEPDDRSIIRS